MNFGSDALKAKIIPDVLAGRKFISLAISEAFAGSDVQKLRCTATKTADGKHYLVNGTKVRAALAHSGTVAHPVLRMQKWITKCARLPDTHWAFTDDVANVTAATSATTSAPP